MAVDHPNQALNMKDCYTRLCCHETRDIYVCVIFFSGNDALQIKHKWFALATQTINSGQLNAKQQNVTCFVFHDLRLSYVYHMMG